MSFWKDLTRVSVTLAAGAATGSPAVGQAAGKAAASLVPDKERGKVHKDAGKGHNALYFKPTEKKEQGVDGMQLFQQLFQQFLQQLFAPKVAG